MKEDPGRLKVLVCDASTYRADGFRLSRKPEEPNFTLEFVSARGIAEDLLKKESWDIVFLSGFMGNWNSPYELLAELVQAHKAKRVRAVVVFNPILKEGREFCKMLDAEGIPVQYYPYDSSKPATHHKCDWRDQAK